MYPGQFTINFHPNTEIQTPYQNHSEEVIQDGKIHLRVFSTRAGAYSEARHCGIAGRT